MTQTLEHGPVSDVLQREPKKKKTLRRVVLIVVLAIAAYVAYSILHIFISPDRNIQQVYLIPKDAVFIIQSSEPVRDWEKLSSSAPWQELKKAKSFAEISERAETLDSTIRNNKTLLSLVGKRDMLISIHKTRATDWDFLVVIDLQKMSKVTLLKEQIETILGLTGGSVTQRKYNGVNIIEMRDPDTRDILYMSFVDNHLIASYTSRLVEAAIDEREKPQIGLEYSFIEAEKLVAGKGLYRIFINYAYLPKFLSLYLSGSNEYIDIFSGSMDFAGLYFDSDNDKMEVRGYTFIKEQSDPYVTALLNSGRQKMKAHEIMSSRTAFYSNIGFDDPATFIRELEKALSLHNKESFDSYKKTKQKLENYFGISMEANLLGWMSGEFALSQAEPGLLGSEPEQILAIRAKNIKNARENMALIEKRVKGRTPVKVKKVDYKGYEINYVEIKGFFRLFFGKMFDRFEKPYYTYVDDYVVFSNKVESLLSFVEDYDQKNLLKNDEGCKRALAWSNSNSTIFIYADIHKFYPQLTGMMNPETRLQLQSNKDVLYSFPRWVIQVVGEREQASIQFVMDYKEYEPSVNDSAEEIDAFATSEGQAAIDEESLSEKEIANELKLFYVEKFQGNVLREFYPDGSLMSESELKNGKRNGRYREYYESGKLKLRGKYQNNQPKGVWKYYTEDGKLDRKERY